MFRVIKTDKDGTIEVLSANKEEHLALQNFRDRVADSCSNSDEFSCGDWEDITEKRCENLGGGALLEVEEVCTMSDTDIIKNGGGVCSHCHSEDTDEMSIDVEEKFITKSIICNVCSGTTIEKYNLVGLVEED